MGKIRVDEAADRGGDAVCQDLCFLSSREFMIWVMGTFPDRYLLVMRIQADYYAFVVSVVVLMLTPVPVPVVFVVVAMVTAAGVMMSAAATILLGTVFLALY